MTSHFKDWKLHKASRVARIHNFLISSPKVSSPHLCVCVRRGRFLNFTGIKRHVCLGHIGLPSPSRGVRGVKQHCRLTGCWEWLVPLGRRNTCRRYQAFRHLSAKHIHSQRAHWGSDPPGERRRWFASLREKVKVRTVVAEDWQLTVRTNSPVRASQGRTVLRCLPLTSNSLELRSWFECFSDAEDLLIWRPGSVTIVTVYYYCWSP